MPYNTTPLVREEPTGTTQLPLSRVKKIIHVDPDIATVSSNAAFLITVAAEMFVQKMAEEAHNEVKSDKKPRRNVQYKDVASAVSHHDYLEFLEDVVPKTVPLKAIRATAAATQARLRGDTSLANDTPAAAGRPSTSQSNGAHHDPASANTSPKMIMNGEAAAAFSVPPRVNDEGSSTRVSLGAMMAENDPSSQLKLEMRHADGRDGDVNMTG